MCAGFEQRKISSPSVPEIGTAQRTFPIEESLLSPFVARLHPPLTGTSVELAYYTSQYSTLLFYALSFLYPAVVSSRHRPCHNYSVVHRKQEFRSADRSSTMNQYDMSRCTHKSTQDTVFKNHAVRF